MLFVISLLTAAAAMAADGPAAADAAATQLSPEVTEGITLVWYLVKLVAFLGGICALGYLAVRVLGPRFSPLAARPGEMIRVVDMKRLDPKTTLYVVEVGGRHALIAVSESEVRTLSKLELDDELIREEAKRRDAAVPPRKLFADFLPKSIIAGGKEIAS